jgi:hypothetical protein
MMSGRRLPGLVVLGALLAAYTADAHIEPIEPSVCTFDAVEVEAPGLGLRAMGVPAGVMDDLRITYDTSASAVMFEADSVPPRAFIGTGIAGALAFPSAFEMQMEASGDLVADRIPLYFTVEGAAASVRVALTTGLAGANGVIAEGTPLTGRGRFTLVGVVPSGALPPPLSGGPTVVSLSGEAAPAPDLDQFAEPTVTSALSGIITARAAHVRALIEPGRSRPPAFAEMPAILRLSTAETTIGGVDVPGGLIRRGRGTFVGRSDGSRATIVVRPVREGTYLLTLHLQGATLPALEGGRVAVRLTYQVGGLVSRVSRSFRASRTGSALHAP